MGVSYNKAFGDGSVVALWEITEGDGKSLSEQRIAVNALIDKVFDGEYRMSHDDDGIPVLEVATGSEPASRHAAGRASKKGNHPVPLVSISHTRGWAAVMTNPTEHVGIDIELADRDFSAVGKKAVSGRELAMLGDWAEALKNSLPPNTAPPETASPLNPRNTVLGLLWCAKEAVYKKLTVPATDFANQIEIESIVPVSPVKPNGNAERPCNPTTEGKMTAIFKHKNGGISRIHLEYHIISGLLLVYTIITI